MKYQMLVARGKSLAHFMAKHKNLAFLMIPIIAFYVPCMSRAEILQIEKNGAEEESLMIRKSMVKISPVTKVDLYREFQSEISRLRLTRREFDICSNLLDETSCWTMYGDIISKDRPLLPGTLLQLSHDPIYIVLTYKIISKNIIGQRKIGESALVVCLNPKVPEGYFSLINKFKPILQRVPNTTDPTNAVEALKAQACKAFANFNQPKLEKI